jgi:hypothetical protein
MIGIDVVPPLLLRATVLIGVGKIVSIVVPFFLVDRLSCRPLLLASGLLASPLLCVSALAVVRFLPHPLPHVAAPGLSPLPPLQRTVRDSGAT